MGADPLSTGHRHVAFAKVDVKDALVDDGAGGHDDDTGCAVAVCPVGGGNGKTRTILRGCGESSSMDGARRTGGKAIRWWARSTTGLEATAAATACFSTILSAAAATAAEPKAAARAVSSPTQALQCVSSWIHVECLRSTYASILWRFAASPNSAAATKARAE